MKIFRTCLAIGLALVICLGTGCGSSGGESGGSAASSVADEASTAAKNRLSGDWQGSWDSKVIDALGSQMSVTIVQDGTSLSGSITMADTPLGTFSGSFSGSATESDQGGTLTIVYTDVNGTLKVTGTYNANTITGSYTHSAGDKGSFVLRK